MANPTDFAVDSLDAVANGCTCIITIIDIGVSTCRLLLAH